MGIAEKIEAILSDKLVLYITVRSLFNSKIKIHLSLDSSEYDTCDKLINNRTSPFLDRNITILKG